METVTQTQFSERIKNVPRSFIRDILKVAVSPDIISFAGGLPNKKFFPVEEIRQCTLNVLDTNAAAALQYSNSEGLQELREQIAANYQRKGLAVHPDQVLITTGSQQALDLIGKVFVNPNDPVVIEEPAYLGAIQALSMYRPQFIPVPLQNDGLNTNTFEEVPIKKLPKMAYLVTNFQNPTGITYSDEKRRKVAETAVRHNILLVEDNPYEEIKFTQNENKSLAHYAPEQTFLLGSFSKTVVPGFRVGWIVSPKKEYFEKLLIAKQAADLHTDIFVQRIIANYLENYNVEAHINKIREAYKTQSEAMVAAMENSFPKSVRYTRPEGGMFCWVEMPEDFSSMALFNEAIKHKVAFVPGVPFYLNRQDSATFRLNFSCSEPETIREGIAKLAMAMHQTKKDRF